jgi:hypothetical protein
MKKTSKIKSRMFFFLSILVLFLLFPIQVKGASLKKYYRPDYNIQQMQPLNAPPPNAFHREVKEAPIYRDFRAYINNKPVAELNQLLQNYRDKEDQARQRNDWDAVTYYRKLEDILYNKIQEMNGGN